MRDQDKPKARLIAELEQMRGRVAALEAGARRDRAAEVDGLRGARHAHAILQNSDRALRTLLDASPESIALVDGDGRICLANRATAERLGKPVDKLIGCTLRDLLPEEVAIPRMKRIEEVVRTGRPTRFEDMRCGRYVENTLYPILDDEGNVALVAILGIDQTERRLAEEALQKGYEELERRVELRTSELKKANDELQAAYDGMRDGLLIVDIETKAIVRCNASMCRMLGYAEAELLALSVTDVHPAGESAKVLERFRALGSGGRQAVHSIPLLRKDGSTFYADIAHNETTYNGRYCSAGFFRDITERRQAEEALRRSEETLRRSERRFRNYFEQGLIGMAVTSLDKHWLEVNDRLCEMFGYSREEFLKTSWVALTHPEDVQPNFRLFDRLIAGEISHFTLNKRFLHKNGRVVYTTIHTRAFRQDDGTVDHIVTLIEDITARREAEEALRASEERYRSVVEDQTEVICRFTPDGTFTFVNAVYCRLFGKTGEELVGRKWQPTAVSEDLSMIEGRLRTMSPANPIVVVENRVYSAAGEVRWMQFVNRGLFDQEGRLLEVQAVGRDVTERRQAQDALERERQSLWRMLQASDHERQTISYDIHDGLAQYLAAAGMQFQMHDVLLASAPQEAKKAYDTAVELVRQSHFEARRLISEVRPPVIDETGIETAISHLIHEERRRGGLKIEYHCDVQVGRMPAILENGLYRIAQEALTNACKHSGSKRVEVSLSQQGQDMRLQVRDWGIGFDLDSVAEGHFGLEGIRQRVRLLGGRLKIDTQPGAGTLVEVVIPVVERQGGPELGSP